MHVFNVHVLCVLFCFLARMCPNGWSLNLTGWEQQEQEVGTPGEEQDLGALMRETTLAGEQILLV